MGGTKKNGGGQERRQYGKGKGRDEMGRERGRLVPDCEKQKVVTLQQFDVIIADYDLFLL